MSASTASLYSQLDFSVEGKEVCFEADWTYPVKTQEETEQLCPKKGKYRGCGGSAEIRRIGETQTCYKSISIDLSSRPDNPAGEKVSREFLLGAYNEWTCLKRAQGIPDVPKVYDFWLVPYPAKEAVATFLILELVDTKDSDWTLEMITEDLEEREDRVKLAEKLAPWLLRTIASLHRREILHGDLNQMNILEDIWGNLWLVDFGQATAADLSPLEVRVGHRSYPEHRELSAETKVLYTPQLEVWELGCLLWQIYFISHRIPTEGPLPRLEEAGLIGTPLGAVLLECLEDDPARRPGPARLEELAALF
jgi:serine/threonine protein kinase